MSDIWNSIASFYRSIGDANFDRREFDGGKVAKIKAQTITRSIVILAVWAMSIILSRLDLAEIFCDIGDFLEIFSHNGLN